MSLADKPQNEHAATQPSPSESALSTTCLPPPIWFEVAAGTLPEAEALICVTHAAGCARCGALLREAVTIFGEEPDPDEVALLATLQTGSPAGMDKLAKILAVAATTPRAATRVFSWPSRVWFIAPLAAAVLLAVLLGYRALRPASDETLLAQSYDRHRLTELRIPGAKAVALASPTRGHNATEASSSELLQLKLRAQQQFDKTPNDAALRQTLGRIAIVEHDGETARRQFEMAEALNPQLPRLKFDFGTAYFELAEAGGKPLDYARAIDFFGQYLQSVQQQDSVALFDQAICWERQNADSEAIQDFEAALALEKDDGWRKEIGRHLQRLKARDAPSNGSAPRAAGFTPAAFLAHPEDAPGKYETWLDIASREWLPHRTESAEIDSALRQLASLGLKHNDAWLNDMLDAPLTANERSAEAALSHALKLSASGSTDDAIAAASQAAALFNTSGQRSGAFRAQVAHVYLLRRLGQGKDCLAEAESLQAEPYFARYRTASVALQLEVAACHAMLGNIAQALSNANDASSLADKAGLSLAKLRGASFAVAYTLLQGGLADAWMASAAGLAQCSQLDGTASQQALMLTGMKKVADRLDLPWTRAGLAEASANAATASGNHLTAAYAFEDLALAQLMVGENAQATGSFGQADRLIASLGKGNAASHYEADWVVDRAMLTDRLQGSGAALQKLQSAGSVFTGSYDLLYPRMKYFTEYADVLRQANRLQESFTKASQVIVEAGGILSSLHGESERREWLGLVDHAYGIVVLDLLDSNKPAAALEAWQRFETGPYANVDSGSGAGPATHRRVALHLGHGSDSPLASQNMASQNIASQNIALQTNASLTIVYAHIQDRYIGWSFGGPLHEPVRPVTLTVAPASIESRSRAFRSLCEDPIASQRDIASLGSGLYRDLIAPFQAQIDGAQVVAFDLDSTLANLPLAALTRDGRFFGFDKTIVYLRRSWSLGQGDRSRNALPENARLLVLQQVATASTTRIPEAYDESREIASGLPGSKLEPAALGRSGSQLVVFGSPGLSPLIENADVIHYSGHGLDEDTASPSGRSSTLPAVVLARNSLRRCSLAVLAACRTLGERENKPDDQASFEEMMLASGASNVLGTQWDVDSNTTRKLMLNFYMQLNTHQSFSESLRRAQQSIASDPTSAHPYFWAAFQLVSQ